MYNRIMVPLDGSPFSERALPLAVALAHRSGAELRLVHVLVPLANKAFLEEGGAEESYLDDLARKISAESGVKAEAVRLVGRQAVGELSYYSAEEGIDLVVMATHGWGGLQRAWLGSVTDGLVREARVPVLAFRPGPDDSPRLDGKAIERILVPLDGSPLSEEVLDEALALGGKDAEYTLLRVIPYGSPSSSISGAFEIERWRDLLEGLRVEAGKYLDGLVERYQDQGYTLSSEVRIDPQPARLIMQYANEIGADLIAQATQGRSGVARFALGSVTDKVLRGADVPVLVVRGEMPRASEPAEGGATAAAGSAE